MDAAKAERVERCCDLLTDVVVDGGFEATVSCSALVAVLGQLAVRMGLTKQHVRDLVDRAHDDAVAYQRSPRGG